MGIMLKSEFSTTTIAGYSTACKHEECIMRNYRDIDNVEKAVNYVKRILTSAKVYSMPSVDFVWDNETTYGLSISRLYRDYNGKYVELAWDGTAQLTRKVEHEKLTAKLIKGLYLELADFASEREEKAAV